MKLSVIIPTVNRATLLDKTLVSIAKVNFSKEQFEVIVIDNGSTDNTKEVCDKNSSSFENFSYHYAPQPGLHVGRNLGYQIAKSNYLVYADDDIIVYPSWLEAIYSSFEKDPSVALVGGKNIPDWEETPPDWIFDLWDKKKMTPYFSIVDLGDEEKTIPAQLVFGCNFSVRKDILKEAGGFNPDGVPKRLLMYRGNGETYISDYIEQQNLKTHYHPDASVYHFVPKSRMNEKHLINWNYRSGISRSYTESRKLFLRHNGKRGLKSFLKYQKSKLKLFRLRSSKKLSFQQKLEKSHLEGFFYHQNMLSQNQNLKNWVKRENYLDINDLPYFP